MGPKKGRKRQKKKKLRILVVCAALFTKYRNTDGSCSQILAHSEMPQRQQQQQQQQLSTAYQAESSFPSSFQSYTQQLLRSTAVRSLLATPRRSLRLQARSAPNLKGYVRLGAKARRITHAIITPRRKAHAVVLGLKNGWE